MFLNFSELGFLRYKMELIILILVFYKIWFKGILISIQPKRGI